MTQSIRSLRDDLGFQIPAFQLRNGQQVAYSGSAGVIGTAISQDCKLVLFWTTTDAYVRVADGAADADVTDIHVPAGVILHQRVENLTQASANVKIAAKQMSANGVLHVMEAY